MGEELQGKVQNILVSLDLMLGCIRAVGGWKYREGIQLQDEEIRRVAEASVPQIKRLAIAQVVAEAMLREPAPSFHPRWQEYQDRVSEIHTRLLAVGKVRDGPAVTLGTEGTLGEEPIKAHSAKPPMDPAGVRSKSTM